MLLHNNLLSTIHIFEKQIEKLDYTIPGVKFKQSNAQTVFTHLYDKILSK